MTSSNSKKTTAENTRWRPTLRATIGMFICLLVAVTGGTMIWYTYARARESVLQYSRDLIDEVAGTTQLKVESYIEPANAAASLTLKLIMSDVVGLDPAGRQDDYFSDAERYFFDSLSVHTSVAMLNYGDRHGNFVMVKRQSHGGLDTKLIYRSLESEIGSNPERLLWKHRREGQPLDQFQSDETPDATPYDPRTRPWYTPWTEDDPENPGFKRFQSRPNDVLWTDVYLFSSDKLPGITASLPHLDESGELLGVVEVDIALVDLSDFLRDLQIKENGTAFLIDGHQNLVAARSVADLRLQQGESETKLRPVSESEDARIRTLARSKPFDSAIESALQGESRFLEFEHDGGRHLANLTPIDIGQGRRWVLAIAVPEDDFVTVFNDRMKVTMVVLAGVLAVSLIISFTGAAMMARSLRRLVAECHEIRQFRFQPGDSPESRFREIHDVLTAFEEMKSGLRSFQKYVPPKLVELLIEGKLKDELGGEKRDVTVFFTGLVGFSDYSRDQPPQTVADTLALYLEVLTQHIQDDRGVVDKFISDGLMAFWGAPDRIDDHAERACRTALGIHAAVDQLEQALPDAPRFPTAVGIHSDRNSIVGNFGSNERFNYTCIGNGVNLASRLESMNEVYGTRTLISQETFDIVGHEFVTRRVDLVTVPGAPAPVFIYELVGLAAHLKDSEKDRIERYHSAWNQYREQQWETAAAEFQALLELQPGDLAVAEMLRRCRSLQSSPPGTGWAGVFQGSSKSSNAGESTNPFRIFVSYRRADANFATGRICERLVRQFGKDAVFQDADIRAGRDFRAEIFEEISRCDVVLVVMGPQWLSILNERTYDTRDYVRIECEAAIERSSTGQLSVIPVLLAPASTPAEDDLPIELQALCHFQNVIIRPDPEWETSMDRLIEELLAAKKSRN